MRNTFQDWFRPPLQHTNVRIITLECNHIFSLLSPNGLARLAMAQHHLRTPTLCFTTWTSPGSTTTTLAYLGAIFLIPVRTTVSHIITWTIKLGYYSAARHLGLVGSIYNSLKVQHVWQTLWIWSFIKIVVVLNKTRKQACANMEKPYFSCVIWNYLVHLDKSSWLLQSEAAIPDQPHREAASSLGLRCALNAIPTGSDLFALRWKFLEARQAWQGEFSLLTHTHTHHLTQYIQ